MSLLLCGNKKVDIQEGGIPMDKDYNRSPQEVLDELHTSAQGLTPEEAQARLK